MCAFNVVVAVTGSVAAYKACAVVSDLVQRGHRVRVVATPAALRFVGAASFEGLTGEAVRSDLFAAGSALDHIELGRWADAVLVCPATAHTLNRLAAGLADDLLGALFLAHDRTKPFLLAPAMNPQMWSHPATVAARQTLAGWGVVILPVAAGRTACGELGDGRLLDPAEIVVRLEAALARPRRRLRVLITSGGTAEPIDRVRVLSNTSTGATGALIADRFVRGGHEVVLLRARSAAAAPPACEHEAFGTFAELDEALGRRLGGSSFDLVVHAAAVGDFAVAEADASGVSGVSGVVGGKLEAGAPALLRLRPQPKLVDRLRARSLNPALRVVAFKLTAGADDAAAAAAIAALRQRARPDFIVHNDLGRGPEPGVIGPADIYDANGALAVRCAHRGELAAALVELATAGRDPAPPLRAPPSPPSPPSPPPAAAAPEWPAAPELSALTQR
jgi:phosphopantothenoylcysteine decarboxylase/phosphopantothenate--cysteine ligase